MTKSSTAPKTNPNNSPPQFLINAINALNAGQIDNAIDCLKQGTGQDSFTAYSGIGDIYLSIGENEKALESLKKARECLPQAFPAFLSMWQVLIRLERRTEAIEELNKMLRSQPDMKNARPLLETMLKTDASDDMVKILSQMFNEDPSRKDILLELARAFNRNKNFDEAESWYKKVLDYGPDILALHGLGRICISKGRPSQAVEYMQSGLEAYPNDNGFSHDLGIYLSWAGRFEQGIDLLKRTLEKEPENVLLRSDLLLQLHYQQDLDPKKLFNEHKKWGQIHAAGLKTGKSHRNIPDPDRRLRIGYISADFFMHSVAYFFEPLLDGRDHAAIEVYGYGNVDSPDKITERLKGKFDHYRNIREISDKEVTRIIEHDQIDILVELSGHSAGNRLGVLANKPAPIQVTYLGYPDTTGVKQVDYRLTDSLAEAPKSQQFYTEELAFLPKGFLCYSPPDFAPPVAPLPVLEKGFITFASFNNNKKINHKIMKLWAQILKANDNSQLLLKFLGGQDQQVREHYFRRFEQLGIPTERVKILGRKTPVEHLKLYEQADIALDTYPYNGTTTTCEAIWMGVPTVSLVGKCHASRVGNSILNRVGLESLVASNPQEYVEKAASLASDFQALARIRASLRGKIIKSGFCDAESFACDVEEAYRKMWHRWCRSQGVQFSQIDVRPGGVKELVVDNIKFENIKRTKARNNSIGFNDRYIIKIEHGKHPWKLRTFSEEIDIIKHLNSRECVSCPRLISEGKLETSEKYFIQQRIDNQRQFSTADMVFSLLEQKSFGVCQGDLKRDNLIFDRNSVCYMIDYDQAIQDEKFIDMTNIEYLEWYDQYFADRWNKLGFNITDSYGFGGLDRDEIFSLFKGDSFNLAATSTFKEQITTNTSSGIYHSMNTDKLYIGGARSLNPRLDALNEIEFKQGEKVLDVGCNMGLLSHYLHDRGCNVAGIDMDEKIIIGARMVANIIGKNIKFEQLDLDVEKITEDYDTICLFSVIHHVKNFREVTENISQKCNRIILECALKEYGSKPVDRRWVRSSGWEFNSIEELAFYLGIAFRGFKFQRCYGNVDRKRAIMAFVKDPTAVNIEFPAKAPIDIQH
ncbi:MAG: methyltransferase domain-containing protein [Planctomycetes bacterium]|nr:methyltransferase domain-containing protein [Planctomycetota bacterium]